MSSEIATGITNTDQLQLKMALKGKVIKASQAGAIIDIGVEKPALLHISQVVTSDGKTFLRVEDVLKENQELDVWVRNITKDRIEVSMIKPLALEWREIQPDMNVKGKVVALEKYGAFIDIGAERPGLVHISELASGFVRDASEVVTIGEEVEVKILDFDKRKKQIRLSMKALTPGIDEIEGVTVTAARPQRHDAKRGRGRKNENAQHREVAEANEPVLEDPTAMEIKMREAMEKAGIRRATKEKVKNKKEKRITEEQEEILSRTLESRA